MIRSDLSRHQTRWLQGLLSPDSAHGTAIELSEWSGGRRLPQQAWAVHVNNIRANVLNALQLSFPLTLACTGAGAFQRAVILGLRTCPPASGDLSDYGAWLPEMLASTASAKHERPWRELADLEWCLDQQRRENAGPGWSLAQAASLSDREWTTLQLTLRRPARLMSLSVQAWSMVVFHHPEIQDEWARIGVQSPDQTTHVLVQGSRPILVGVANGEWLAALEATQSMDAATDLVSRIHPEWQLGPLLQALLEHELLTRHADLPCEVATP